MNGPSGVWPDEVGDRFVVEVGTEFGAATVDFLIDPSAVEVWFQGRCRAVLSRAVLRDWLAAPHTPLVVDEVAFSLERMVDFPGRRALGRPEVLDWILPAESLARLRGRI